MGVPVAHLEDARSRALAARVQASRRPRRRGTTTDGCTSSHPQVVSPGWSGVMRASRPVGSRCTLRLRLSRASTASGVSMCLAARGRPTPVSRSSSTRCRTPLAVSRRALMGGSMIQTASYGVSLPSPRCSHPLSCKAPPTRRRTRGPMPKTTRCVQTRRRLC